MTQEEADKETREVLEEKVPTKFQVQVNEYINLEYLLDPYERIQSKQEKIKKYPSKKCGQHGVIFYPIELNQTKYNKNIRGSKKKKKKKKKKNWKLLNTHTFFRIMVIPKT